MLQTTESKEDHVKVGLDPQQQQQQQQQQQEEEEEDQCKSSSDGNRDSTPKQPVLSFGELGSNRRTTAGVAKGRNPRVRSLSPAPRANSTPNNPSSARRRMMVSPRRKTPARSFSANAAAQAMQMFGIAPDTTTEDENNDDDNYDDYKVRECEIQTLVNDREEFQRLKSALKEKGAVTNEILRQRLHVYVHKNRERLSSSTHSQCGGREHNLMQQQYCEEE